MNFGIINVKDCENVVVPPQSDPRCADPAFALANPSICVATPRLIIKPDSGLVCLYGAIQFKAFLVTNDSETDVTSQSTFTSSNPDAVIIGAVSGNATGLSAGSAIITATYNGMTAQADVTAFGESDCCHDQTVAMLVMVDNSKSMSQAFNGTYATKLHYAKAAARRFIGEVNEQKDLIGLMLFNAVDETVLSTAIHDKISVRDMVDDIPQSVESTSFFDAITQAVATLSAVTADRKVLIIISDGQDQTASYLTNNPISLCDDFKNAGNTIMCLGVRAAGKGFTLLDLFGSGGLFVNGYDAVADTALDILSGLKGYFCAGNCTPEGDSFEPTPDLNYSAFENWDVVSGTIDLIGPGLFDVLPGNGLYVAFDSEEGIIQTQDAFTFEAGKTYRIRLYLAGNQKMDNGAASVKIEIGSIFNHTVVISDYTQGFANNSFNFTPAVDATDKIKITSTIGDVSVAEWGPLLDAVTLHNVTDNESMFSDSFDTENSQYVPPRCGIGTTYTSAGYVDSGYDNCYGEGCLTSPPAAQLPDPNPLTDIESGYVPPVTYTSTKQVCVSCPAGTTNVGGVNLIPTMTSDTTPSGTASASDEADAPAWYAFDGTSHYWFIEGEVPQHVAYDFGTAKTVAFYAFRVFKAIYGATAWEFQGSNDGSTWTTLDVREGMSWYNGETKLFQLATPATYSQFRIQITEMPDSAIGFGPTIQAVAFYAPGGQACATASASSIISQADADAKAIADATLQAQALLNCQAIYQATESYTAECPAGTYGVPVTMTRSAISFVSQEEADAAALAAAQTAAEAFLDCTLSNNTNTITNLDAGPSDPYPSVSFISDVEGVISKVTVTIKKLSHTWPDDLSLCLMHPDGTKVLLMANTGGSFGISDVDLVFDDDASDSLPDNALITSGTYNPTANFPVGFFVLPMPGSLDPSTYETTLASLIGKDPNGAWALYVMDDTAGNTGQITNGWELTISV